MAHTTTVRCSPSTDRGTSTAVAVLNRSRGSVSSRWHWAYPAQRVAREARTSMNGWASTGSSHKHAAGADERAGNVANPTHNCTSPSSRPPHPECRCSSTAVAHCSSGSCSGRQRGWRRQSSPRAQQVHEASSAALRACPPAHRCQSCAVCAGVSVRTLRPWQASTCQQRRTHRESFMILRICSRPQPPPKPSKQSERPSS